MTDMIETDALGIGTAAPASGVAVLHLVPAGTPGITATFREITGGYGAPGLFQGVSGRFIAVGDPSDVTPATRGVLYGLNISMQPKTPRSTVPFDDVAAVVIANDGTVPSIVECIYIGHNATFGTGPEWGACFGADANAMMGLKLAGHYNTGIEFAVPGGAPGAGYAVFANTAMHVANDTSIIATRNATDTADIEVLRVGADDHIKLGQGAPVDVGGPVFLHNLPTADPHVVDQVWRSTNGVLMVSNG